MTRRTAGKDDQVRLRSARRAAKLASQAIRGGRRSAVIGLLAALAGCGSLGRVSIVAGTGQSAPPLAAYRLSGAIARLVRPFPGRVGVAVEDVSGGWSIGYDGRAWYPQQSVSKLCTAIAVLDAIDAGRLRLDQPVHVDRSDMSVFHQPIQARLTGKGLDTTVADLLSGAIVESDNAADDILIRLVGGPQVVQATVSHRGIEGVRCGPEEHVLESQVAGLSWRPDYSFGLAFWTARDRLDPGLRRRALRAYLDDPPDGAKPLALVHVLSRLRRGELLSPGSTGLLLSLMSQTRTGPLRLPAGLGPGWRIAHKTGTGQDLEAVSTGNNDVGLLTAPDGQVYSVAVMIASTTAPVPERQRLMAAVARAVVSVDDRPPR
jgi:beta-lactamase class A